MKQLKMWSDKRVSYLKVFSEIEEVNGSVKVVDLADAIGQQRQTSYNFINYCLANGIVEKVTDGLYGITKFGKKLLADEGEL